MRRRLRNAGRACLEVGRRIRVRVAAAIDKEDVLTVLGLILLASGLWHVSHAAALIVPGVILLWMFVPSRPPFIERDARVRRPPV